MQNQNSEIISILVIGAVMAILLVLFIVSVVLLYQRRQQQHEKDLVKLKEEYNQELLRSQIEIQEKTLKNISEELHDNVGQMLSVAKLSIASAGIEKEHPAYETIIATKAILNTAILDLGNLTKSLHTERILQIGIEQAIEFEINIIRKAGLIPVNFVQPIKDSLKKLDGKTSIFVFRMFQEMLNNALKHAKATTINVTLNYTNDNNFVLVIEDDGIGFNVEEKKKHPTSSGGVGLKSMLNRAKLIGGKIIINSKIGSGTCITIIVPLRKETIANND